MQAIIVDKLSKHFKDVKAVDAISFSVEKGELFGILGPNGAGKTTLINMLSTLLKPTSGSAEVAGFSITESKNEVRSCIGIVFQAPALDFKLTARENIKFHAAMYGIKDSDRKIAEVLRLVELTPKADVLVEKFSGGMKRRLEIARSFVHTPKVLFLDEPTLGLDAQTRRKIWEYIKKLNKQGVSIILTTHYMEEADHLCNRVAIIDIGRIIAMDNPETLKEQLGGDIITLECPEPQKLANKLRFNWIRKKHVHNHALSLTVTEGHKRIPQLLREAGTIEIVSVKIQEPSLEDVFLHYTGRTIRETEAKQIPMHMMRHMR